jgi:S1-C subfamily serine protease
MEETSRSQIWRQRLRRMRGMLRSALPFASGVVAALLALLIYNSLTPAPVLLTERDVSQTVANAMASATPPPPFSALVYQVIQPSLVLIQTTPPDTDGGFANNITTNFRTLADDEVATGVIINDQGDILTSLHVVATAPDIYVIFADGTQSTAQIINAEPENDIAVLYADRAPEFFVPATLGNPNAMRIGDEAFVVGHPFSLYGSMSAGVISGLDRTFEIPDLGQMEGLIQVDAAMNPGNSGGPLLNRYGQVVGIVTGLFNPIGETFFVGVGFAVPITTAGGAAGLPPY